MKITTILLVIVVFMILIGNSTSAFPEILNNSFRPSQSLGSSVGNLPPNGSSNAKVIIIEYGNYYDPFSRRFFQDIEQQLRTEYIETGKVVMYWKDFVFLDFPGSLSNTDAANAARCANEQRMFWKYHDILLNQPVPNPEPEPELLDFVHLYEVAPRTNCQILITSATIPG